MSDILKIKSILGYVANDDPLRARRDGRLYEGVIPAPSWSEVIVRPNGNVEDTVQEMIKAIHQYAWQTAKLAPLLKGKTLYETCHNIWDFLYSHIKYKEDDEGEEQLRTPSRSWAQRLNRGIDCDDFSIFAGTILYNLNIPFKIRIAAYDEDYQHVYDRVPMPGYSNSEITIDAVLNRFDKEKKPTKIKDFLVMSKNSLNGINISVLNGIEDDTAQDIAGILSGEDFAETNELEGLGQIPTREAELKAIRSHLERTRRLVHRHPHLIREVEHPGTFLGMVDYALKYWDTNKRDEALGILAGEEEKQNAIDGVSGLHEDHEDVDLYYGVNGLGSYDVLGKAKRAKKFFAKVKQAVKKAGQGIKKIAKKLIRFNPLTITIRAAVLLALKVNLFKVSSKLKWGYLTEDEARKHGFDMGEWKKAHDRLQKAEKLFVDVLQGKAENFKRAILHGRAGGLNGAELGLGVVVAAATAASTTAAVPFITKILNLIKGVDFKKLLAHVDLPSLLKSKKKAEEGGDAPTEDGGSAIPDNGGDAPGPGSDPVQDTPEDPVQDPVQDETPSEPEAAPQEPEPSDSGDNADNEAGDDSGGGEDGEAPGAGDDSGEDGMSGTPASTKKKGGKLKTIAKNAIQKYTGKTPANPANPNNLPVHVPATQTYNALPIYPPATQTNPIKRALQWVNDNPGTTVLISSAVALALYGLTKATGRARRASQSAALSGIKAGAKKKKKAPAKKALPQTISGTRKKKGKRKTKNKRAKPRGKGGKQIRL